VCLRVRAAKSRERLARASWSEPFCKSAGDREVTTWPLVDGSGAQVVPSAPVLEIEVRLASEDPAVSPTIADLSIAAEVAPPIADRDGDGVADAEDACPDRAEDGKGPLPDDGCPDKDGDGIADDRDRCPDLPEDHVLPGAQDGCPDKDGDGIPDPDDACPGAKEDGHAPAPQDGCPDRDSDAVPDASDKCPAIPGEPKYSGCPLVHAAGDDIQMADKIMFQEGSARIDDRSAELLDGIAALLRANDKVGLVEVAGHANRHGTDALNVKLTRDRSAAVVAALVKRGVEAKRLRSAGYGAVCPAVAGETPEADEANRRVELKVLVRGGAPTAVRWGGCAEAEKKGMKPPAVPGAKQPAAVPAKKPAPAPPGPGPKAPPKPKAPSKR
jgi:outer membrane protein OmpA-like peptidoglycan-associated protein